MAALEEWGQQLLVASKDALQGYQAKHSSWTTLNKLLDRFVAITASSYGFICQKVVNPGKPDQLQILAASNIAWSAEIEKLVIPEKLLFQTDHFGLFCESYTTRKGFVCNAPKEHPHSVGNPPGHPPINCLLSLPIFYGDEIIGNLAVANRIGGYREEMINKLQGFCTALGTLMQLYHTLPVEQPETDPALALHSEELNAEVIRAIGEAVLVTDPELRLLLANPGAIRMFDATNFEEVRGRTLGDLLLSSSPLLGESDWKELAAAHTGPVSYSGRKGECLVRSLKGRETPVSYSMVTFLFLARRYFAFILSDITERIKHEEKRQFLAFLSHELRNPLQIVDTGISLLMGATATASGSDKAKRQQTERLKSSVGDKKEESVLLREDTLGVMLHASRMLSHLVNEVIDLTRLESGASQVRDQPTDVREVLEDLSQMLQLYNSRPELVEVRSDVRPDVPQVILIDKVKLEQVLLNLATNGVKYTSRGTVAIICEMRCTGRLAFRVVDTGIGIRPEHLDKLFHLYQVLDQPTELHSNRTGLGLSIAQQLCHLIGGHISVRSEYGKGSEFSFDVPLRLAESSRVPCIDPLPPATDLPIPVPDQKQQSRLVGLRILVADDNHMLRKLLVRILTSEGAQCVQACTGAEALSVMQGASVEAVLLDCIMPEMDGFTAAAEMRRMGFKGPLIAITGCSLEQDLQRCMAVGFNSFLVKPVSRDRLVQEVLLQCTKSMGNTSNHL